MIYLLNLEAFLAFMDWKIIPSLSLQSLAPLRLQTEPEPEPEPEPDTEPETEPETEPVTEPEIEPETEPETEPEPETESENESESKSDEEQPILGVDFEDMELTESVSRKLDSEREAKSNAKNQSNIKYFGEHPYQGVNFETGPSQAKIEKEEIDRKNSERKTPYFSCYRKSSEPVHACSISTSQLFDFCEDSDLIQNYEKGIKIMVSGKYRLTFTGLMKSTSKSPINIEIRRVRDEDVKVIGRTGAKIQADQGTPQLGISSTVDMLENLMKDDLIDIRQLDSGNSSYLRSSDWNLVRLEGHVMENSGLNCMIVSNKIRCNEEKEDRDNIKITEAGLYEVSLSGMTFQVSTYFSFIKHERKIKKENRFDIKS